ncbi:hypothetical protein SAMN06265827_12852 [Orenia metallireducens]|uniref:RES domain-containing protein n=1 Tax=Orenia metallireducens TaxID=1413210 RepID=A0A285I0L5_9FIRM|nr:hypothetical protein [Orenia metallireducens]SNY41488.1 hypothetical protein SAMN06265827_12852 [Orenia metallireducens]
MSDNVKITKSYSKRIVLEVATEVGDTRTGRRVPNYDDWDLSFSNEIKKLQELIVKFVENETKDLEKYLDNIVAQFKTEANFNKIMCYKGVKLGTKIEGDYIGPAPKEVRSDQRYSTKKEECLYLITDNNFIKYEIEKEEQITDWLEQKYEINLSNYKIANLSSSNNLIDEILENAFFMSERGKTHQGYNIEESLIKQGKSKYLFSQLLAKLFKKYNWDGFYISGVQGKKGATYNNIVLFESITSDNWEKWVYEKYDRHSKNKGSE